MSGTYRAPKGTYDVYPGGGREPHERPELWETVERVARDVFGRYNYSEMRLPVFEEAELFVRSSGETSDVVTKEMFLFQDKGGRELALRPFADPEGNMLALMGWRPVSSEAVRG